MQLYRRNIIVYIIRFTFLGMGIFKKKSPEVLDLAELQKRGILERARAIEMSREGRAAPISESSVNSNSANSSGLGFLSSLAGAGGESNGSTGVVSSLRIARREHMTSDVGGLKNKIEDIEYKIERLIERLERIEEKMGKTN